jgi:hypothetical protein
MAVISQGGSGGGVRFEWRGATVLKAWEDQIQAGMQAEAAEVLDDLRNSIHVQSGDMRDEAFAEVEVRGTKRTLRAGSASDHAIYEELGTSRRPGHPQIRGVMDRHIPHVTEKIRQARGLG